MITLIGLIIIEFMGVWGIWLQLNIKLDCPNNFCTYFGYLSKFLHAAGSERSRLETNQPKFESERFRRKRTDNPYRRCTCSAHSSSKQATREEVTFSFFTLINQYFVNFKKMFLSLFFPFFQLLNSFCLKT